MSPDEKEVRYVMTRRTKVALGITLLALAVIVVAALVGFGGSSTKTSTTASAKAQVVQTWTTFFAGSTPASKKVQLLQGGPRFARLIEAQAASPLAQQTKAIVTKVTLESPTRAQVVYTIMIAGKPALKNQLGTAVRVGGTWKVGDASFCALLSLQGGTPPACRHA
jgi:hypothetical protein